MNQSKIKNLFFGLILLFFIGCEGEEGQIGPTGLNSLVNITNEPSGTNCKNGGIKVEVGIDNNSNGSLDDDEILSTSYVCNGADGNTSLTSVTTEPSGTNCENGGIKIDSGVDTNGDGTLDDSEITATAYVCNGIDGNNSLTKITNEAAGTNCENGGLKIDSGVDTNGDGTLDDNEISATAYVCNGIDGNNSLTKITNEAAGTNCENGGLKIDSGVDTNGDGTLDDTEISATAYVCNGVDGNQSLTKVSVENAGSICEAGGIKIESGIDSNSDSILDSDEINSTEYVCNGDFDKLIRIDLGEFLFSTTSTDWQISSDGYKRLYNFNKLDYTGVDSITFVPSLRTSNASTKSIVQLYNITDDIEISGTEVESNSTEYVFVESNNIYDLLPETPSTLAIRLRSETSGISVGFGINNFLFIYRE